MTRDEIIRMAREAGVRPSAHPEKWDVWEFQDPAIERFAALVAAAEREACAKIVETHQCTGWGILSAAIRARGNT
jgi:hypothetical protein